MNKSRRNFISKKTISISASAALIICVALLLGLAEPLSASRTKQSMPDPKAKTALRTKVKELQAAADDVNEDLYQLDLKLDEANKQLDAAMLDLQRAQAQEQYLQDQLDVAEEAYQEYQKVVGARLASFYKSGRAGYVEMALNAKSFADFAGRIHYMRAIMENDRVMVLNMRRLRDSLADYKEKIESANTKVVMLANQIKAQHSAIEKELAKRKETLDKIMNQKQYYVESLDKMEQESQEISRMIRSQQSVRSIGVFSGRLAVPARGGIISPFGMRVHPRYGIRKMHTGIDITCRTGTPVFAAESGTVLLAGSKRGYGQTVIIMHSGGVSTLYGHGSRILVSQGETVKRGDLIMYSGATGNATGPHLHFEVRVNGEPTNPVPYF